MQTHGRKLFKPMFARLHGTSCQHIQQHMCWYLSKIFFMVGHFPLNKTLSGWQHSRRVLFCWRRVYLFWKRIVFYVSYMFAYLLWEKLPNSSWLAMKPGYAFICISSYKRACITNNSNICLFVHGVICSCTSMLTWFYRFFNMYIYIYIYN